MTGKDLILYILQNNLEDQPVFTDGGFLNLLSAAQFAVKFEVGEATVKAWFEMGLIEGIKIGEAIFIPPNAKLPNKVCDKCGRATFIRCL